MVARFIGMLSVLAVVAAGLVSVQLGTAPSAQAAGAQFRPGHIISDEVFFDSDAMSVQEIQNFLDARVPNCSSNAVCLKDFRQTTANRPADPMCAGYTGRAGETAAQIIHAVARSCGVNPQVILVTLQKEQRLVTSTAPSTWAWTASMGYACPDTAACDAQYYGFFNQVYAGTRQLVRYGNPPGTSNYFTWFPVGAYSNVRFHPDATCGSSRVLIENRATAALYYYTPYQPTAAALAAGYAAAPGDRCASYGNRNFFNFFTDWFGPTYSESRVAIDAAYARSAAILGRAISDYTYQPNNGGGTVRAYENGAITWTESLGAHVITGDFRAEYGARGGTAGPLGWPASSQSDIAGNGDGRVQAFQNGALTRSTSGSFHYVFGSVRAALASSGGVTGPLGWPTGEAVCSGATCTQSFQNASVEVTSGATRFTVPAIEQYLVDNRLGAASGPSLVLAGRGGFVTSLGDGSAVVWSRESGALRLAPAERAGLATAGGLAGYLGWPLDEVACGSWCVQAFEKGVLAQSPAGPRVPVRDAIWRAGHVDAAGAQPLAVASTVRNASGEGLVQAFADGAVTSHPTAGTVRITGALREAYGIRGGLGGALGWPTTNGSEITAQGETGLVQGFQNGALVHRDGQNVVVSGSIRTALQASGGITGTLGWPVGDAVSGLHQGVRGTWQDFQMGAIFAPADGSTARVISGETWSLYGSGQSLLTDIGWPSGDPRTLSSSFSTPGSVQGFTGGAIVSTELFGTVSLKGSIRAAFGDRGGVTGPLGWPTSAETCEAASGICTQQFEGGSLSAARAG